MVNVNWKAPDATDRLLSAIIASLNNPTLDHARIAKYFGEGATTSSIENRLRAIKREAMHMRSIQDNDASSAKVDDGGSDTVKEGGSAKSSQATPTKSELNQPATKKIKTEEIAKPMVEPAGKKRKLEQDAEEADEGNNEDRDDFY